MTFVVVANLDDLEVGDTLLVEDLREPICLIRLDDEDVRAIHNTCTHQQQPLHEGSLQDDDTPTAVEAEGRQVMLYRHHGTLYALDNVCSHAGGLLSRGTVTDLTVTCPLHGARFALADGHVGRGPANQPQPALPTRIRNGWIEVRGSLPAPRRPAKERTQP